MKNEKIEMAWGELHELGVSEETLQLITCINGYNLKTLHDVLYAYSGERMFSFENNENE